ncbi:hypothetical protein AMS68_007783 [Peltaster fructicola]|uniref:Uncharacterized protein n=1 Tax=Peltaster fructicola TaxID=286661 RepID=A0A6H0Y5L6_9PEZI|nr:hypothetical protein AMS68_007783 [Peltaster fructicola]
MDTGNAFVFYDIASNQPRRTFAPNPWKTRFALNFKGVPYSTQWVELPDIGSLREGLGVQANRTGPEGEAYHTLPLLQNTKKGDFVGDSFEIAMYLDNAYPDHHRLIQPHTTGLVAAFNAHVDGLFTKYSILCTMPFDPAVLPTIVAIFMKRVAAMGKTSLALTPEQREQMFKDFEANLGELAKAYRHTGGTTDWSWRPQGTDVTAHGQRPPPGREEAGVYLDGEEPGYPDFIVGAWLKMMQECLPSEDWQRLRSWQQGLWGRIVDALEPWTEMK